MPEPVVEVPVAVDIFARQESIPLELPAAVTLVGVGGVGSWIAYFLALAGVPKLYLFDSDEISATNLNRTPFTPADIGKRKVDAMAALIKACRPRCEVVTYPNFSATFADGLSLMNDDRKDGETWVVPSTDTWASRKEAHQWARTIGHLHFYLEAAAEGEFGSIADAPAEWATADEENPGYASVPVWVGPSVAAALMACNHILHGQNMLNGQSARLGWLASEVRIEFQYRKGER